MYRYTIILVLLVWVSASPAMAVDTLQVRSPDPVLEAWRWTEFDRSSGLAGVVRDIFEGQNGNIWFATDVGAQRYDGYRWTTYTTEDGLGNNSVRTVYQTRDGAMWFSTAASGISRLDGESWTTYTTEDGLASNNFHLARVLQARDGTLWAGAETRPDPTGTQSGLTRFDGTTWTTLEVPEGPPRPPIHGIFETSGGVLWFSTHGYGVLRFDGSGWRRYTTAEGLAGDLVIGMMESRDGSLWFACYRDGISRFDGRQWRSYTVRNGLPEGRTFGSVWQTADGTIWTGGSNGTICRLEGDRWKAYTSEEIPHLGGVRLYGIQSQDGSIWFKGPDQPKAFRFDGASRKWMSFAHPDPLVGGYPTPDGSVWFGTKSGAVRYDGVNWLRYTPEDGLLDAPILNMAQTDDGSLWFLAGEFENLAGVSRYHNGTWSRYTAEEIGLDDVSENGILQAKDGSFWLAGAKDGFSAVSRYDGQTWRVYTVGEGLVGRHLRRVVQAPNGDLWFGAGRQHAPGRDTEEGDGIIRYDGERWTSYTTEDGLSHNRIYGLLAAPDGTIWVGTRIGLSWFDGTSWNSYTQEDGLPAEKPVHLQVIDGDLWFTYGSGGTGSGGVTRYDGKTWETYTTQDGLTRNFGSDLYPATDGTLWHATRNGVSRFDGTAWTSYTVDDGLPGNDIRRIWQSQDGRIWFITRDGQAGSFFPDKIGPETMLEPTLNEISSAGNILVRWSGRDRWEATALKDMRYQWRMDGGDWSPWVMRTDLTFTKLSSGEHRFEVRAMDRDGNLNPTPAVHAFIVEAPWWKNPWVLGGTVVLLGLVGVQTGRVVRRDRRLQQTNTALSHANKELFGLNEDLDQSNKELIVEAALERVRAKALGMQESNDLLEVTKSLLQEFQELGYQIRFSGIRIWNEEKDTVESCIYRTYRESLPYHKDALSKWLEPSHILSETIKKLLEAWRQGQPYLVLELAGEEVIEYYRRRLEHGGTIPSPSAASYFEEILQSPPDRLVQHFIFFSSGCLMLSMHDDRLSDPDLAVAKRFADVFDLAYSRVQELQEKEERNRELQETNQELIVEAALERVRGKAQGMQQSKDLWEVSKALSEEFKRLEIPHYLSSINILDEERDAFEWWPISDIIADHFQAEMKMAMDGGLPLLRGSLKALREIFPEMVEALKAKERGEIFYTFESSREEMIERRQRTDSLWTLPDGNKLSDVWDPEQARDTTPDRAIQYVIFNDHGHLTLYTEEPLSETNIAVAKRFSDLFGFAYGRFLELQEKEERNRELEAANKAMSEANKELFQANQALQRDSAVERIRGEVQAMDQASDFERVLSLLSEDLKTVGLSFDTCGIDVLDEPVDEPTMAYFEEHGFRSTTYTIDPDGTVTRKSVHLPLPLPDFMQETIERFIA